ncbi:STAS domain-containing protein [Streptomyces sp. BH097]|uniref:STAS domain-containing protein n=1 Tax=unclassified Streptomyces TaxID=2593676 RepID=UPI003BB5C54E
MSEDSVTFGLRIHLGRAVPIVEVWGELDILTAHEVPDRMLPLLPEGCHSVVLDLRAVTFMDCGALSMLVRLQHRFRTRHGRQTLVLDNPFQLRVLRLTRLDEVLDIAADLDIALARHNGATPIRDVSA